MPAAAAWFIMRQSRRGSRPNALRATGGVYAPTGRRAIGYVLTELNNEQALLLFYGTGQNGKSTYIETLRALLGPLARATPFATLLAEWESRPKVEYVILRSR